MKLSEFLQWYKEAHGISGRELARRCDLSSQTIFNILKGVTKDGKPIKIDTETLGKISTGTGYFNARFSKVGDVYYVSIPGVTEDSADGPVYTNDEEDLAEYLEELRSRPEARMLLQTTKGMSMEQVKAIVAMIENIRGQ